MHISWLGMSCFKIQTKDITIVTNPFADKVGLEMPHLKADIVLVSDLKNEVCNNIPRLSGENFLIQGPGEYETKNVFVYGLTAGETDQVQATIYLIDDGELTVAFLGLINHSLNDAQLEIMEGADILLLPVSSLTAERRSKILSQIEPRIVIPMYFQIKGSKLKLESLNVFLKEFGAKSSEPQDKIIVRKKDLPQEETKIIVLEATA